MPAMTICLSTNGTNVFRVDSAPTRLLVATAGGLSILQRERPGAAWQNVDTTLRDMHPSALLFEPDSKGLFAGIHTGGLYFSGDGDDSPR
jgi:hypothetical protein